MKLLGLFLIVALLSVSFADGKRKRKFDGDFEFADEDDRINPNKSGEKKRWIHDPSSDLCRPLNCKKKELCLLEDAYTAVCVSKKDIHKNRDDVITKAKLYEEESRRKAQALALAEQDEKEDDDDIFYDTEDDPEEQEDVSEAITCKTCPVATPTFLCGSDNRTYSSLCRMDYHNCIHHTEIRVSCKGFCPCKELDVHMRKKQRQAERISNFLTKYKNTLDKNNNNNNNNNYYNNKKATPSAQYTFVPEDFKYENKHYKYIKYTKFNKDNNNIIYSQDKDRQRGYNEVLDSKNDHAANSLSANNRDNNVLNKDACSPSALQAMGNRLLDWFSVVMADTKKRRGFSKVKPYSPREPFHYPSSCKGEARWMFGHLDLDADSILSVQELYDLEHDQNERCIKPFLDQCDTDRDSVLSPKEWCKCFDKTDRPCAAAKRRAMIEMLGAYLPECDSQGYYRSTQCHSSIGFCWCVDKHGVEYANTRTRGKPDCEIILKSNQPKHPVADVDPITSDDDDHDEDDSESPEGSADQPLDF